MAVSRATVSTKKGSNAPLIIAIVGIVLVLVGLGVLLFTGGYFEATPQRCGVEELYYRIQSTLGSACDGQTVDVAIVQDRLPWLWLGASIFLLLAGIAELSGKRVLYAAMDSLVLLVFALIWHLGDISDFAQHRLFMAGVGYTAGTLMVLHTAGASMFRMSLRSFGWLIAAVIATMAMDLNQIEGAIAGTNLPGPVLTVIAGLPIIIWLLVKGLTTLMGDRKKAAAQAAAKSAAASAAAAAAQRAAQQQPQQ